MPRIVMEVKGLVHVISHMVKASTQNQNCLQGFLNFIIKLYIIWIKHLAVIIRQNLKTNSALMLTTATSVKIQLPVSWIPACKYCKYICTPNGQLWKYVTFVSRFLKFGIKLVINIKRRCGILANETTLHQRPNDTEINSYRSPYSLQQLAKPIPYSRLQNAPKCMVYTVMCFHIHRCSVSIADISFFSFFYNVNQALKV